MAASGSATLSEIVTGIAIPYNMQRKSNIYKDTAKNFFAIVDGEGRFYKYVFSTWISYSTIFSHHGIVPIAGDGCDDTGTCRNAASDKAFSIEKADSLPTSTALLGSNGKSFIYIQTCYGFLGKVGSANYGRPQRPALFA